MRRFWIVFAVGIATLASIGLAQQAPTTGPYKVLRIARVGGTGGFDYVYADDGKIITTLPLAGGSDGAVFNPTTMAAGNILFR